MATLYKCLFGPRLHKIYSADSFSVERNVMQINPYEPNKAETCGDRVIRSLFLMWSLSLYTSPVIFSVLYKRGQFTSDGISHFVKLFAALGLILFSSLCLRGIGRYSNKEYITFISTLSTAQQSMNRTSKKALMQYDFEFHAWPVEFRWDQVQAQSKPQMQDTSVSQKSLMQTIFALPCQLIGYVAAHTIGHRMVYPGAVGLVQMSMNDLLLQGRSRLVKEYGGERAKLLNEMGEEVDVMVVDRRSNREFFNGNTLVICSEGNAGFYEVGIMSTPLEAGYSVLGWNHPGFGGSTGTPFAKQDASSIDVVMQYAIHDLGFKPSNIVLFAWSIGGYAATYAAMRYPGVQAVILDATFDDLVPLALSKMPSSWGLLVKRVIRDYMDLNIAEQLCRYPGPVHIIRRTRDEMITTRSPPDIASNRGNRLLKLLLESRYPKLMTAEVQEVLEDYMSRDALTQSVLWTKYEVNDDLCRGVISSFFYGSHVSYPNNFGDQLSSIEKIQMTLYLARAHMTDFNSTHCTPLPKRMFRMPWEPSTDDEFVKVDSNEDDSDGNAE